MVALLQNMDRGNRVAGSIHGGWALKFYHNLSGDMVASLQNMEICMPRHYGLTPLLIELLRL
jgi:hypothetical protein